MNRPGPSHGPGRRARFHSPNPSAHPAGGQWKKERVTHVHTRRAGSTTLISTLRFRGAAILLGLLAAGALVMSTGVAGAAPQPTVSQVQQRLKQLTTQAQKLEQEYAQAQQALSAANQQLAVINTSVARDQSRFNSLRRNRCFSTISSTKDATSGSSAWAALRCAVAARTARATPRRAAREARDKTRNKTGRVAENPVCRERSAHARNRKVNGQSNPGRSCFDSTSLRSTRTGFEKSRVTPPEDP